MDDILQTLVGDAREKFTRTSEQVWARVHFMVGGELVGKFNVREDELVVNNSAEDFNGKVLGLRSFENRRGTKVNQEILRALNEGVVLRKDRQGNIYAENRSLDGDLEAVAIGWNQPEKWSLSKEMVAARGRVGSLPVKLFDMSEYKSHIAIELQKNSVDVDHRKLHLLSAVVLSFQRRGEELPPRGEELTSKGKELTPASDPALPHCWLCVVNLCALDVLANDAAIKGVISLQHLNLSGSKYTNYRRCWSKYENEKGQLVEAKDDRVRNKSVLVGLEELQRTRNARGGQGGDGIDGGVIYSWMEGAETTKGHSKAQRVPAETAQPSVADSATTSERMEWAKRLYLDRQ